MILPLGLVALAAAQNPLGLGGVTGQLPANSSNVRFQTVAQGVDGLSNVSGLFVFNEATGWINYWRANHQGAAPSLEQGFFNNWRMVAIHVGGCPTDGYGLNVLRMDRRIDRATICALETIPPRNARTRAVATAPWIVLRVERGAFDFNLQVQRMVGYASGAQTVAGGSTVQVGGATVTFGPGGSGGGYCPPK